MNSIIPIITVNLNGNIKVLNSLGEELATQPSINIGEVSGTIADKTRSATVTIDTTGILDGIYKIKILAEAVQTSASKSLEVISTATFEVDSTAPSMPTITLNPTTWTNLNVTATLTKSNEADTLEYSTNGTTWNAYISPLTITSNSTVYAREIDSANNVSNQAIQIITIIDRIAPTVVFGTNGGSVVGTTVTASDTSGSGINATTLQYVWDTQNSTTPSSGWATFTNGGTLTKTGTSGSTHYLWIKIADNAGNVFITTSNVFTFVGTTIYNFAYSGSSQTWTVPYTGTYKLEVWGAQGGDAPSIANNKGYGGKGGYSVGNITLTAGQVIYIYIGGINGYNGGGSITSNVAGVGGGGTDIRINGTSLNDRIIVAGGGGGGGCSGTTPRGNGGAAGLNGEIGYNCTGGYSGTQTSGGSAGTGNINGYSGIFGKGGNGCIFNNSFTPSGAGGGGYYGGGSGGHGYGAGSGGGGGSSYIGSLTSAQTIAGNTTMPNPIGGTMTGNTGNGYVRITII